MKHYEIKNVGGNVFSYNIKKFVYKLKMIKQLKFLFLSKYQINEDKT